MVKLSSKLTTLKHRGATGSLKAWKMLSNTLSVQHILMQCLAFLKIMTTSIFSRRSFLRLKNIFQKKKRILGKTPPLFSSQKCFSEPGLQKLFISFWVYHLFQLTVMSLSCSCSIPPICQTVFFSLFLLVIPPVPFFFKSVTFPWLLSVHCYFSSL